MHTEKSIENFGETELIKMIEELIWERSGKKLYRDDAFYHPLSGIIWGEKGEEATAVLNSDMFVSTTDAPPQMSPHQMGRKAVIMNISDLVVKGVNPRAIIISLGLPSTLKVEEFKELIKGIIKCTKRYNMEYIGGDLNQTQELVINPTVIGFQLKSKIIPRHGAHKGDILVSNGQFGLTGVGFEILLDVNKNPLNFERYHRAIKSVLEPSISEKLAKYVVKEDLANCSIDSSDGLAKSLHDLAQANPGQGFEIDVNHEWIDKEAISYAKEFEVSLKKLVFNGGEEFIHLFSMSPSHFETAQKALQAKNIPLYRIGKVIDEEKILIREKDEVYALKLRGFEHFKEKTA